MGDHVCMLLLIMVVVGLHRGHGTYASEGNLVASVAGVVERVNKLICVRPLRSRWAESGVHMMHTCVLPYLQIQWRDW